MKSAFDRLTAPDPLNRILEYEFSTLLPDQVLNFVDKLSMAHSVEVRPPFLDPEFVNYAARIPGHLKIRNGNVKAILKRLASRWLPEDLVNRPKEGFVMPINHWIMRELRPFISSVLAPQRIRAAGFLHETEVHRILNEHFEGKADHATRIWSLTTFQVWCDRYLGGKSL